MTMKPIQSTLIALFAIALLYACQSKGGEKQGMAQFTTDSAFKEAHEIPAPFDFDGRGETLQFATPDGQTGTGYYMKSETDTKNYLLVIHEWWGLNDHIRQEAERLFDELGNAHVLALDMYDGQVAADREQASKLMGGLKEERALAIVNGALDWAGKDARIATIGWCFGGGWSLRSSILAGERGAGCVMYYGMPVENAADLAPLKADVLGIFAKQDNWINEPVVQKFETLAKATGKNVTVKWFDAQHAFANPSNARYDEKAAKEANALALEFLKGKF
jgi:carboxymethylenebutenolidase